MTRWTDFEEPEEDRPAIVKSELARIGLSLDTDTKLPSPDAPASPAELERKRQREAETLRRHDIAFGLDGGLAESLRRVARPHYSKADETDRDD